MPSQEVIETEIQERGTTIIIENETFGSETSGNETVATITITTANRLIETPANEILETSEIPVIPIIVVGKGSSETRATETLGTLGIFEMGVIFGKGIRGTCEIQGTCETQETAGSRTFHEGMMIGGQIHALLLDQNEGHRPLRYQKPRQLQRNEKSHDLH